MSTSRFLETTVFNKPFVVRGMNGGCRGRKRGRKSCPIQYGGLEPMIASYVGTVLTKAFETQPRTDDIGLLSVHIIAFGSRPPSIKSMRSLGRDKDGHGVYVADIDLALSDAMVVLGELHWYTHDVQTQDEKPRLSVFSWAQCSPTLFFLVYSLQTFGYLVCSMRCSQPQRCPSVT